MAFRTGTRVDPTLMEIDYSPSIRASEIMGATIGGIGSTIGKAITTKAEKEAERKETTRLEQAEIAEIKRLERKDTDNALGLLSTIENLNSDVFIQEVPSNVSFGLPTKKNILADLTKRVEAGEVGFKTTLEVINSYLDIAKREDQQEHEIEKTQLTINADVTAAKLEAIVAEGILDYNRRKELNDSKWNNLLDVAQLKKDGFNINGTVSVEGIQSLLNAKTALTRSAEGIEWLEGSGEPSAIPTGGYTLEPTGDRLILQQSGERNNALREAADTFINFQKRNDSLTPIREGPPEKTYDAYINKFNILFSELRKKSLDSFLSEPAGTRTEDSYAGRIFGVFKVKTGGDVTAGVDTWRVAFPHLRRKGEGPLGEQVGDTSPTSGASQYLRAQEADIYDHRFWFPMSEEEWNLVPSPPSSGYPLNELRYKSGDIIGSRDEEGNLKGPSSF